MGKITTLEMEVALMKHFKFTQNVVVPNISFGMGLHECDLLVVRKSMWMIEIEIKISKQDFLNDLKKKHGHKDRKNRIKELYYAIPDYIYDDVKSLLPKNAGLIVCSKKRNKIFCGVVVKPKKIKNSRKLTQKEYIKLLELGCMKIFAVKNRLSKVTKK